MNKHVEILVIGAGQAGLAMGYYLKQTNRSFVVVDGSVLVVDAGNSGLQIAGELSQSREVYLSTGHEIIFVPRRILNRTIFWWFYKLQISKISVDSRLAKYLQNEPIIGTELKPLLEFGQIKVKSRTMSYHNKEIVFTDDTKIKVNNIVWATGFQYDFDWIRIPGVLNSQNKPVHQRGISPVKGIYFLGLPWLYRRDSAQLSGISYDAKYLYDYLKIH